MLLLWWVACFTYGHSFLGLVNLHEIQQALGPKVYMFCVTTDCITCTGCMKLTDAETETFAFVQFLDVGSWTVCAS